MEVPPCISLCEEKYLYRWIEIQLFKQLDIYCLKVNSYYSYNDNIDENNPIDELETTEDYQA